MLAPILRTIIKRIIDWSNDYQNGSILAKASRFVACEMIDGDYIEFGVYQGKTFIDAHRLLKHQFKRRIGLDVGGENQQQAKAKRQQVWNDMRFIAFDSFEGLPELTQDDTTTPDFTKGQYACSLNEFNRRISKAGVPAEKVATVKGFFCETCVSSAYAKLNLRKAAIVWLDADLYSSTKDVLNFLPPLLQDGTILIFDDWFSYKGSPFEGVQRAFREWEKEMENQYVFSEYQRDSWKRMSFITTRVKDSA
ncbi:8-demethyl-8-(2,3-dimethoxy-alpha-L-rhamnosyl)-tetracenomycin-C 4'-O-methyltransferase [Halioglobus japonicus]|nr:8-demethyl-8-(2,3-dimethoxy-alpha-L-rhamnosyl)-tetracenomycin-C 4'-O-methyltransferase [Halioglobus japonicus]